ncbi:MAG: magnesium transporter [Bacteroidia bacterium]|jgi:magnesium transporter
MARKHPFYYKVRIKQKQKLSSKSGLPPGSFVHIGEEREAPVTITYTKYDQEHTQISVIKNLTEINRSTDSFPVHWINIDGLTDKDLINEVGAKFNLHQLLLEDVLNTEHRPKVDEFDEHLFFTLKALHFNKETLEIDTEQVSVVLGKNYVISFQEKPQNAFEPIIHRMEEGRFKNREADYLAYSLIDLIVDSYYNVMESIEEHLELIEDQLFTQPKASHLYSIQGLKRILQLLRKTVFPLREAIQKLQHSDTPFVMQTTQKYFRDLLDHTIHITESIDNHRDTNMGLKDLYLSSQSNQMNKIIHLLTLVSTIFIPLTFIVGVYGMNFDNIPELHNPNGYFYVWALMLVLTIVLVIYFKRRKWM